MSGKMVNIADIVKGDRHAVSRAITLVENFTQAGRDLMDEIAARVGKALRIGVTGPPGAGKSTLVDGAAKILRKQGKGVGVIAVDPTSPFTGGALLGDRIRMTSAVGDEGMFIRSMATRDGVGGIARATLDVADLLDVAGKDYVIIETVGVGQSEIEISRCVDVVLLVLCPESGDGIQAMKSGVMEIADIVAINKADREGADRLAAEVRGAFEFSRRRESVPILLTEATTGKGLEALVDEIAAFIERRRVSGDFEKRRLMVTQNRIKTIAEFLIRRDLWGKNGSPLDRLARDVAERKKSPYEAAQAVLESMKEKTI